MVTQRERAHLILDSKSFHLRQNFSLAMVAPPPEPPLLQLLENSLLLVFLNSPFLKHLCLNSRGCSLGGGTGRNVYLKQQCC